MRTGELPPTPRWHTASAQGPRSVNADAVGAYADPDTHEVVFALADGVGDGADAARAARVAAGAAARTPASHGPAAALLAAQRAVAELDSGDCVMVVAMPCDGGYRIGWVGDTRAYAWTGDDLVQLTTDHTLAEYFRSRGQAVTPRMEHVVTTSVRTARVDEFGAANLTGDAGLLLTSDGVHKRLTEATIQEILAQPDRAAAALVETAIALGGTDNTTAIVVEPHFREAPTTTLTIPMAA